MTVKGIEVSGTIYDNEDETARNTATEADSKIGNLADLETTVKTDVISAINEVAENVEKKNLLWSNPNPTAAMGETSISLSLSEGAKGLILKAGFVSSNESSAASYTMNIEDGKSFSLPLTSSNVDYDSSEQLIYSRILTLNQAHTSLDVGYCSVLTINTDDQQASVAQANKFLVPQEIYEIL